MFSEELLSPPFDFLLPTHHDQHEGETYQWKVDCRIIGLGGPIMPNNPPNYLPLLGGQREERPLMAGHHEQALPLTFLLDAFPLQTSRHRPHRHLHGRLFPENLSGGYQLFFENQLSLDLASLLYNNRIYGWCPATSRFLPFYLFFLDPVVGNLFNCFLELLLRGDPAEEENSCNKPNTGGK